MVELTDITMCADTQPDRSNNDGLSSIPGVPAFLNDDVYHQLKRCFGTLGKGNRPQPPTDLPLTNRLLLQLRCLKDTTYGKSTAKEMEWFQRLFPNVSFPAERLRQLIDITKTAFERLRPEDQDDFLQQEKDLDFVSTCLLTLGIRRGQLLAESKVVDLPSEFCCTNQHIVDLDNFRSREKLKDVFVVEWATILCGGKHVDFKSISKCLDRHKTVNRAKTRHPDKLTTFLTSPFVGDLPKADQSSKKQTPQQSEQNAIATLTKDTKVLLQASFSE